jgi:hypothetical protein
VTTYRQTILNFSISSTFNMRGGAPRCFVSEMGVRMGDFRGVVGVNRLEAMRW